MVKLFAFGFCEKSRNKSEEKLVVDCLTLFSVQMVTDGKGTSKIGVSLSLKLTITGLVVHFS